MRIVRIKLKPAVSEILEQTSRKYGIEDSGFSEDLFCLFRSRGQGLPTDKRMETLADVYSKKGKLISKDMTLLHLRKRKHVLTELIGLAYFKSLCVDCKAQPHVAVTRLLQTFREFTIKRRQASCLSCQYLASCDFGKQYSQVAANISNVIDPDWKTKTNPLCPDLPNIEGANAMYDEIQKIKQLNPNSARGLTLAAITQGGNQFMEELQKAEEEFADDESFAKEEDDDDATDSEEEFTDEEGVNSMTSGDAPGGKGGSSGGGSHTGRGFARVQEQFMKNLAVQNLQLFELGRQLDEALAGGIKGKFKPTQEISKNKKAKRISESAEVAHVDTTQHAMDDAAFDAKLAKRELTVSSYQKHEDKKHLLYCLKDISASMQAPVCPGNSRSFLTRNHVGNTLLAALCQRVDTEGGMMFARWFSDRPGAIHQAKKKPEFPALLKDIIDSDANGGGTSIIAALHIAHGDITSARDEIGKCEVLLVTDMDDTINPAEEAWIKEAFDPAKGIKLNVLNCNSGSCYGNAHIVLKKVSNKMLTVDHTTLKLTDLVQLVK
jgi:hypothetical protein